MTPIQCKLFYHKSSWVGSQTCKFLCGVLENRYLVNFVVDQWYISCCWDHLWIISAGNTFLSVDWSLTGHLNRYLKFFYCYIECFFCCPVQVPILLFIFSQCCPKGKIYCICISRGRDRSASDWTEARNWPSRTCWRDIFWYVWQIWASQWTIFGQLLYFNCEFTLSYIFMYAYYVDRLTITYLQFIDRVMMLLLTLSQLYWTSSTCIHW